MLKVVPQGTHTRCTLLLCLQHAAAKLKPRAARLMAGTAHPLGLHSILAGLVPANARQRRVAAVEAARACEHPRNDRAPRTEPNHLALSQAKLSQYKAHFFFSEALNTERTSCVSHHPNFETY